MSVLLTDTFDDMDPFQPPQFQGRPGWQDVNGGGQLLINAGVDQTTCLGCSRSGIITNQFPSIMLEGALRAQVAALLTHPVYNELLGMNEPRFTSGTAASWCFLTFSAGSVYPFVAPSYDGEPSTVELQVYFCSDGSIMVGFPPKSFSEFFLEPVVWKWTAPHVFPVDGTQFGFQWLWRVNPTSVDMVLKVNNVVVGTFNGGEVPAGFIYQGWDSFSIHMTRYNNTGGFDEPNYFIHNLTTVDNVELDDAYAAIDWPAGNALKLDHVRTCRPPEDEGGGGGGGGEEGAGPGGLCLNSPPALACLGEDEIPQQVRTVDDQPATPPKAGTWGASYDINDQQIGLITEDEQP